MATPIKLHVFDFDGTLFRSPNPPRGWEGEWWGDLRSLSSPWVPESPTIDWWNVSVVEAAQRALSDPEAITVLITGRKEKFSLRLKDLLGQVDLSFDRLFLSPEEGRTAEYKMEVMDQILSKHRTIRGVSIWEDREDHLRLFADGIESKGVACFPHLITTTSHELAKRVASAYLRYAARYKKKTEDEEGNVHYEYSERQVANRHNQKAERVERLRKDMGDLRKKVRKDLSSKDPKVSLAALVAALIDETCERVGNEDSAKDGHFGVTGWQKKHVSFSGGKATFKYVGKSGVKHEKTVETASVVKRLKELAKGKSDDDCLLSEGDFKIKPEHVNKYLGEFEITAKDIRGLRANQEMCRALKERRGKGEKLPRDRKGKDKILKKEFADALKEVAEIVGHEQATLRSDYLVPGLEDSFMKDGTVLSTYKEATKTESEREDEATEKLVRPSPKKKPPRDDLRKHRVEQEDADLDEIDDDLSRNFKKVAVRIAMACRVATRYRRALSGELEDAFLESVEGREFTNPKTKQKVLFKSLPSEEQKRLRSQWEEENGAEEGGDEDEGDEDEENEGPRSKDPKSDDKRRVRELQEKARSLRDAPAFSAGDSEVVGEALEAMMEGMTPEEQTRFVEDLVASRDEAVGALASGNPAVRGKVPSAEQVSSLQKKYRELTGEIAGLERSFSGTQAERIQKLKEKHSQVEEELRKAFAKFYVRAATREAERNPLTFIHDETPLDPSDRRERRVRSVSRFRDLSSEDRSSVAQRLQTTRVSTRSRIEELEEELREGNSQDPTREEKTRELEALKNRMEYLSEDTRSLELASVFEGDDDSESSLPTGTRALLKGLKEAGVDVSDLLESGLGTGEDLDAGEVSRLVKKLPPSELEKALEAVDPSGKLAKAWRKVYEGDGEEPEYVWPIDLIRNRSQRKRVEEAHEVFVEMLTDAAVEDSAEDRKKSPLSRSPREKSPRTSPSSNDFSFPEGETRFDKSEPYESHVMDALEKLDIEVE